MIAISGTSSVATVMTALQMTAFAIERAAFLVSSAK
ncbi:hypothetical protein SAMN04490220_7413 [Rhodococcus jostii]|uniref:Uncharacterized protein n=1 Tax=Rhodococcus jostii TaxID=132919 RepID=A0A1H5HZS0_RHOJO|nr:hypothetical protein SAMN04490220_7413 [Rhodococcus jostii]